MTSPAPAVAEALACRADPDLFFAESPADVARAKALCAGCPARGACLAGALDRGEPWGVWGGELLRSGAVVATKRGRGRPRGSGTARHRAVAAGPLRDPRAARPTIGSTAVA